MEENNKKMTIISKLEPSKQERVKIKTASDIHKILKTILEGESDLERNREHFWIMGLTYDKWLLSVNTVALGDFHSLIVNPLDTFRYAIDQDYACYSIIAHNHPSGVVKPSDDDISLSNDFYQFSRKINIVLLDSLVVSLEKYFSFRKMGYMNEFRKIYEDSEPEIVKDEGVTDGKMQKKILAVKEMLKQKIDLEEISNISGFNINYIKRIGIEGNGENQKIDYKS